MISTRPKKFCFRSAEVLWMLGGKITDGRLRQISREFELGYLEPDSFSPTGQVDKYVRWYSKQDVMKIIEGSKRLTKAVKNGELDVEKNLKEISGGKLRKAG